jgi:hypothetical protein
MPANDVVPDSGTCAVNKAIEIPPPAERRPKPRRRVLLKGLVTWADGARSFPCTIRNLTDGGARITLPPGQTVPSNIYFINLRERSAHEALMVWNNGSDAGIAFVKTYALADLSDPKLDYLNKLWHGSAER